MLNYLLSRIRPLVLKRPPAILRYATIRPLVLKRPPAILRYATMRPLVLKRLHGINDGETVRNWEERFRTAEPSTDSGARARPKECHASRRTPDRCPSREWRATLRE